MSKPKTAAVGMLAACAAATATVASSASSSSKASASTVGACCSSSLPTLQSATAKIIATRIPRGGSTAETSDDVKSSASRERGERSSKQRKKKKRRAKQQSQDSNQRQQLNTDDETADGSSNSTSFASNTSETSSSTTYSPLPPAAQSILAQTCHYDVLGITNTASQTEIQKAYRRRCVLTHPDKIPGGDRSAFDKVSLAYDVLGCEKKRAVYDKFGLEGFNDEGGIDVNSGGPFGFGGGSSFFGGSEMFREFFGTDPFFGRRSSTSQFGTAQQNPFRRGMPRNRDLRYQLEATLEELYAGITKTVAIQQPNPLRPHFPYRKEVEVELSPGLANGQAVKLACVVDSVKDASPADIIFIVRERRHPIFTRRGDDLAMEVKISFSESIVGYERKVKGLDGKEILIGSPMVERVVKREELVDAPVVHAEATTLADIPGAALPDGGDALVENSNCTNATSAAEGGITSTIPQQVTKTTTLSYRLPPSIIRTGDVHVLKGHGMPKRGGSHHHHDQQYGDLYVQYTVETPGSGSKEVNVDNLSPEERVELARLLSKLDGGEHDPTSNVVRVIESDGDDAATSAISGERNEANNNGESIQRLSVASASDFGRRSATSNANNDHDEHLRHDEDEDAYNPHQHMHGFRSTEDISNFFQRAFGGGGRSSGFGGPFGLGTGGGTGFHYFSSSSGGGDGSSGGFGYGHPGGGDEDEDYKMECNQM